MQIIDNTSQLLGDDLRASVGRGTRLRIAASCFSIYAFEALKSELSKIDSLQFVFTAPTFVPTEVTDRLRKERREFFIPKARRESGLYGSEFEIQLRNKLTQRAVARECADWIRKKARFRSNTTKAPMQQFMHLSGSEGEVAYMPISGFTAVDLGYQKGDEVILCVADSIRQAVHPEKDFVGHVGGDDFIVIFQSSDVENRCQLVLNLFAERRMAFYSPQQIQQGGITAQNRQGEPQFFELISLAIGVVHPDPFFCRTHHEVSSLAADAKHQAKQHGGNHLFISRRRKITPALDHADMAIQPMAS